MRRIPYADLERSLDDVLAHIDAGESVMVTREGVDFMRLEPIREAAVRDVGIVEIGTHVAG